MQTLKPLSDLSNRPRVLRARRKFGMLYGLIAGLGFAFATWGMDAYLLSRANELFPWLKLAVGALLSGTVSAVAGWLAMKLDRSGTALLIWLANGAWLAWLTVALPLEIMPQLLIRFEPALGPLLHYQYFQEFAVRFGVAYVWVAIFSAITGLLELPLCEPAVFATSLFGRIAPFIVCIAVMGISGYIVDSLTNEPLRNAVVAVNQSIQFAVDHRGQTVDPKMSRQMHQSALRTITELIPMPRRLVVQSFNQDLGQVHVLVRFENSWVQCLSIYEQLSNCNPISP